MPSVLDRSRIARGISAGLMPRHTVNARADLDQLEA